MRRPIGSSVGIHLRTPVVKRIRAVSVTDKRRCATTVFDRSTGRFESSSGGTFSAGSFHVVNTNVPNQTPINANRQFKLSGKTMVIPMSEHNLDVSKPMYFSFARRIGSSWVHDVMALEIRVADSGEITVLSSMAMDDIYLFIHCH